MFHFLKIWAACPYMLSVSFTPFISPNAQSLRTELHFQFIRFAAATLLFAFTPSVGFPHFWRVRFKKRSKIEQKDIITPMHCLAFPSALFGAPFHIDNRTVANCGFWLEYASKTPLEVGADLPRRMRLFWLPVSNNAASERSHQTALFSKRLWLRIIGLIWKGYLIRCKNEALKKIAPQKHHEVLQRSEYRQVTGFILLISAHRLLC